MTLTITKIERLTKLQADVLDHMRDGSVLGFERFHKGRPWTGYKDEPFFAYHATVDALVARGFIYLSEDGRVALPAPGWFRG